MLQSAFVFAMNTVLRSSPICFVICIVFAAAAAVSGQVPSPTPAERKEEKKSEQKGSAQNPTAEMIVETAIVAYAGRREILNQIRKTTFERGTATLTNANGQAVSSTYQKWVLRGEPGAEKVRIEQDLPDARYSLVRTPQKIFGIYNGASFQPREDAVRDFENHIYHSIDALLWYKENGSKIELAGKDKVLGVDFHLIDLTDKQRRKTRYYISAKYFRVMMLDYESGGVKYTRKFYDYRVAQGTLVPHRTVLMANGRVLEESHVGTVTFGQKVDEGLFSET